MKQKVAFCGYMSIRRFIVSFVSLFNTFLPISAFVGIGCLNCAHAQSSAITVSVDSPAYIFSPGNWVGDNGRGGHVYRQSWYNGAYFRFAWTTTSLNPSATLLLDTSELGEVASGPPEIAYSIDGVWTGFVRAANSIPIEGVNGPGKHLLTVVLEDSQQYDRWGRSGDKGLNVVRLTGIQLDPSAVPTAQAALPHWILEVGDSITEGIYANNGQSDNLADYSYFVGQALQQFGYEYGLSACGYSGWLRPGDGTQDVPGYYVVTGTIPHDTGGTYDDAHSRWNKIDSNTGLLDDAGHISGYGGLHQEPSIITINYGTNDGLSNANPDDTRASIIGSLIALRRAAPQARIFLIIPFGQFDAELIRAAEASYLSSHPKDVRVFIIDLGETSAKALSAGGFEGGLHPNMRGHAVFAAQIAAFIVAHL